MYTTGTNYGIAIMSGKNYKFYILSLQGSHKEFKLICSGNMEIMNKHSTGGQSAVRFERLRDIQINHYIKFLNEQLIKSYLTNNNCTYLIEKIIIAGPKSIKNDVMEDPQFKQYFSDRLLCVTTTSEINENTVHEIYEKNFNLLETKENIKSKETMKLITDLMVTNSDVLIFGQEIFTELKFKTLKMLIISDDIDEKIYDEIKQLNDYKCEVIIINHIDIKQYGDLVGIKWY